MTHRLSEHDSQVIEQIFNPECVSASVTEEIAREEVVEGDKVKAARQFEIEGIRAAERGKIEFAIRKFDEAIKIAPNWASTYNNRAQAYQLVGKIDEAVRDLERAIDLSEGKGRVAALAFTQRGIINRLRGKNCEAEADFQNAARLGNPFAKAELAKMNPYAALCGQMLQEMFEKVREGTVKFS